MPYDWSKPYDSGTAYNAGNPQSVTLLGISSLENFTSTVPGALWDDPSATWDSSSSVWSSASSLIETLQVANTGSVIISMTGIGSQEALGSPAINNGNRILLTGI